jgi:uncharacterized protein (TIGR00730 family)
VKPPEKAYRNIEFIESAAARPVRILAEFLEPQERFRRYKIHDTIVFFGSARVKSTQDAKAEYDAAVRSGKGVEEALRMQAMSRYYDEAMELASRLTTWSKGLGKGKRRFIICSGGGPGIMEAANRGASQANGLSIGFNISIPTEQSVNPYVTPELNFEFHYFFIRKYWFAYMAKALVIFPGGFGTLDELAEMLTLIQTRKIEKKVPIVIYGRPYWDQVLRFSEMARLGMLSEKELALFRFCDTPTEAFEYLTGELTRLYLREPDGP